MKILLANGLAYPTIGGIENSLRFIGRELVRAGHEVKVFCFRSSPEEPLRMKHEGVEIIRFPCKPVRWPHVRSRVQLATVQETIPAVLKEFQPDAIWSRSVAMGWGAVRSGYKGYLVHILPATARLNADSYCLHTKGMPWQRRLLLLGLWSSLYFGDLSIERRLLQCSRPVVFSENMRRAVLHSYGRATHDRTVIIHPGIDGELFSPSHGKSFFSEIENRYGISEAEPNILFVGRFSPSKNLYGLLDAFARLETPCRLILVGLGPEEQRLRSAVKKRRLKEKVVFVGSQSELLPGFYAMAKVFVNPSFIEPFGQTLLEAQACGIPVVAYGGNPNRFMTATEEIIQDGKTGGVVKKVGARALAEKINSILSLGDKDYSAMSQRARDDVLMRFSWPRFVAEALALSC